MIDSDNKPVENTLDYLVPCKPNDVHWFVRRDRELKDTFFLRLTIQFLLSYLSLIVVEAR